MWGAGCILGELLLGRILFEGEKPEFQIVKIIKVLGTPTVEDIKAMNPNYTEYKFPKIRGTPLENVKFIK